MAKNNMNNVVLPVWRERFFDKVNKRTDGCWVWTGCLDRKGYGKFKVGPKDGSIRRTVLPHRWLYEHINGEIKDKLPCDHLCRVPSCVNPEHIEPVTVAENTRRGMAGVLRIIPTHCQRGHALIEANVYTPPSTKNKRVCRICKTFSEKEWRRKNRKPLRDKSKCQRGHALTEDNIYVRKGDGAKLCRACRALTGKRYAETRKKNKT